MTKAKSVIITAATAILLFGILYLTNTYSIRWFRVFEHILAVYGYIQAVVMFYTWVREPSEEPRHISLKEMKDVEEVQSGKTIPENWLNPFKKTKEDKKNDTVDSRPAANGLSDAGNKTDRPVPVQSGTDNIVWTRNGKDAPEHTDKDVVAFG